MELYVFDLDGTLANCDHRQGYARDKDWDTFHSMCHLDEPYPNIVRLFHDLDKRDVSYELIIITGRTERHREQTVKWLSKHGVYPAELLMRRDDDFRPDIDVKLELVDKYLAETRSRYGGPGYELSGRERIVAWFEDRDRLVEQLREEGLTVLQVKAGGY